SRGFHPHLTLGRVKGKRNLKSLLTRMESLTFESPLVQVSQFNLMSSVLRASGSTYSILKTFPFQHVETADH
ncbi:MAG: hypothetical protein HY708_07275, partial [Ignavibacteriae bacterium]|nr:hypothetical protein [Ignavibacteriota bacterium]